MQERIEEQETALREWENKLGCSGAGKAPHVVDVILGRIRSLTNELALQREALELGIECPYVDPLRAPEMPADIVLLLPMHKGGLQCRTLHAAEIRRLLVTPFTATRAVGGLQQPTT